MRHPFRTAVLALLILLPAAATPAHAAGGMVSAADPRAAEAGRNILREGGSAADAAIAMMLALTVVEPQSSGIGGGGFLLHHDARTGTIGSVDGREAAPASAGPDRFLGADGRPMPFMSAWPGGYSVGVPGNIRLAARVHARWGRLPWKALFAPAITLAEEGFKVTPRLNRAIANTSKYTNWQDFPAIAALYLKDGEPAAVGTLIRNPALAKTLRTLADEGPDPFYTGEIARQITDAVATTTRNPTALTAADLAAYQAKDRPPVCGKYRAYKVCSMGPPSSGALTMLEILGLLERFDIRKLGKDNPVAWHLIAEAMQLAYADREMWMADADFVKVPVAGLIDPAYLAARSRLISPTHAAAKYPAGNPKGAEPRTASPETEPAGTTHFVAVDGEGDVATMTSTVESGFGSQLVAGGFVLNNELTDFSFAPEKDGAPVANRVGPGKRPMSAMTPTIVYDASGKPVFTVGAAGGQTIIMQVTKAVIAHLDWGLSAEEAVALPALFRAAPAVALEDGTAIVAMKPALEKLGHTVVLGKNALKANAAERTADGWIGAADPRSEGVWLKE
ncbi:gamma-glutamyltransferase [Sphingomonas sp. ID0503]|uniref:gamma-glutamyltransferase n=1 Tax=Sphingomonas sp. ID0503 TaxID=3399691 RepID=UPI003AFB7214